MAFAWDLIYRSLQDSKSDLVNDSPVPCVCVTFECHVHQVVYNYARGLARGREGFSLSLFFSLWYHDDSVRHRANREASPEFTIVSANEGTPQ